MSWRPSFSYFVKFVTFLSFLITPIESNRIKQSSFVSILISISYDLSLKFDDLLVKHLIIILFASFKGDVSFCQLDILPNQKTFLKGGWLLC